MRHSMDGDGRSYTLGLMISAPSRWTASLQLRHAELNRGRNFPDTRNTVAQEPVDLRISSFH